MKTITQALAADHNEVRALLASAFADPRSVPSIYPKIANALRRHDKAESETLYRALGSLPQEHPQIQRSTAEHAWIGSLLNDLDQIAYSDPRFFSGMRELVRRLDQHLAIEESVVFSAAKRLLPLARQRQLAERYETKMGRSRHDVSLNPPRPATWRYFVGPLSVYYRG